MDARTRQRADAGDADACASLGMALLEDVGTSGAGVAEAAEWLQKAVTCSGGRHPEASFTLGCLAARCAEDAEAGGSVGEDGLLGLRAEAAARWTEAAEQGHGRAACFLGKMLMENAGAGRQDAENSGMRWLERAADAGDALGMYNLGVVLWGRSKRKEALRLWEGAAKLGDPEARLSLAVVLSGEAETTGGEIAVDEKRAFAHAKAAAEGVGAESGGPRALLLLANFFADGNGCVANLDESSRWRDRALAAMTPEERNALGPDAAESFSRDRGRVRSRADTKGEEKEGSTAAKKQPSSGASKGETRRAKPATAMRGGLRARGSAARIYGGGSK
jgi:TPR repeat protein